MSRLSLIVAFCWSLPLFADEGVVDTALSEHLLSAQSLHEQVVAARNHNPHFDAVLEQLKAASRVRSEFIQTKTMRLLQRPLVSAGRMIFDRGLGLYWHIETPFPSTLLVTDQQILQRSGEQRSRLSAQQNPVAFGFAQVFFHVLSGNFDNIFEQFEVIFTERANGWKIALVPRDEQMRAVVATINLTGSGDLDRVDIVDHAGDSTSVEFLNRQSSGPSLSDEERSLYAF